MPRPARSRTRGKITDPLLLIHGMSDDNVVFENTTALDRQAAGRGSVPFEMMLYPGETHASRGPEISAAPVEHDLRASSNAHGVTPPE